MTQAPILNGVTLRRPNKHTRTPEGIVSEVQLANGATTTYHRGHRTVLELSWVNMREADAALVDAAGRLRGAVSYVDIDGTTYVVMVEPGGYSGLEAVPGTSPVRYSASLSLRERSPR